MASETDAATPGLAAEVARTLRSPFVPRPVARLAEVDGYLAHVWPQLAPSVDTMGFLGSALYMADMALDAVEEVYEPLAGRAGLIESGVATEEELRELEAVLDVFHWVQPQLLLVCAALAEAFGRPRVGGQGRAEPRPPSEREEAHLRTEVRFAPPDASILPEVVEALGLEETPDLYRAVAVWPRYLEASWEELQHLVAYPDFRRRGRALYYYARSGSRFLAQPLEADADALRAAGLSEAAIDEARAIVDASLPALATMMMHGTAMRVGLGITEREVVKE